jgi:hypothetical protein
MELLWLHMNVRRTSVMWKCSLGKKQSTVFENTKFIWRITYLGKYIENKFYYLRYTLKINQGPIIHKRGEKSKNKVKHCQYFVY